MSSPVTLGYGSSLVLTFGYGIGELVVHHWPPAVDPAQTRILSTGAPDANQAWPPAVDPAQTRIL